MISIIITAYKEEKTIAEAIKRILHEKIKENFEIIVLAPDKGTRSEAEKLKPFAPFGAIKTIKDENKGKPSALNLAIKKAKGDILIFTDGDVHIEKKALKNLLNALEKNTIVTGRPITTNPKTKMLGYWGHILFDIAHRIRVKAANENKMILISGYLWATHKNLLKNFNYPENLVTEDEYLSYYFYSKGTKLAYAPKAKVSVKYPENFSDWSKQKVRTLGGSYQIEKSLKKASCMRSFSKEASTGFKRIFSYPKTFKQWVWVFFLIFARLWVWLKAFWIVKVRKKHGRKVWKRVESTK